MTDAKELTTEQQMLKRAQETGAYHVMKWISNSWLPWKAEKLRQKALAKERD